MPQDTQLAYGVAPLSPLQRRRAAEVNLRAMNAQYPEPDAHEDLDKWLWWCKARLMSYCTTEKLNKFAAIQVFKEIKDDLMGEDNPADNCDFHVWFTHFNRRMNQRDSKRRRMERENTERAAKRRADIAFRPHPLSNQLKAYLIADYGLEPTMCDQIFINTTRFAVKPAVEDPRAFISNCIMTAENLKFNNENQYNSHWFAMPEHNLPFLSAMMLLMYQREVPLESRMPYIRHALGNIATPFLYTGTPSEALTIVTDAINIEHPEVTGYYTGGFVPDTEAAMAIPLPGSYLSETQEADAYLGPKRNSKENAMTNNPSATAVDWTTTSENGRFWGTIKEILPLMAYKDRSPFVHQVLKDKFGKEHIREVSPDELLAAVQATVAPAPPLAKYEKDELSQPTGPAFGSRPVEAPKTDEGLQGIKDAVQNAPSAKFDGKNEAVDDEDDDPEEDKLQLVPGKTIGNWLLSSKTLTGVEAVEIVYWLNTPHQKKYYGSVKGPGGKTWTDLSPVAVRRRFDRVFGPQGIGWKLMPSSQSAHESRLIEPKPSNGNREMWQYVMTDYVFSYALETPNGIQWVEVGGIGASDEKENHKYAMHGANTGLMKRAMSVLGGFAHFAGPDAGE